MKIVITLCLLLPVYAVGADQAPRVNYIFMGPGAQMPDLDAPLTTIARGGLAGAEGGFSLLVKGLILAIPTALSLALSKLYSTMRTNSQETKLMRQEQLDVAYSKYYLAKTKHLLALMDYHKTYAQWQTMHDAQQASQQALLEKVWQANIGQSQQQSLPVSN